ncbi:MAG TPA: hypothetical protein VM490_16300 [Armatimonadaceae bacterium]|nr:hypothetical protein [Armatimonadaceae bacterium]
MPIVTTFQEALCWSMEIDGALGCALVDTQTGMCLGERGIQSDLTNSARKYAELLRGELRARRNRGEQGAVEDLVLPGDGRQHLLRVVSGWSGAMFLYILLDSAADIEHARRRTAEIARGMVGN